MVFLVNAQANRNQDTWELNVKWNTANHRNGNLGGPYKTLSDVAKMIATTNLNSFKILDTTGKKIVRTYFNSSDKWVLDDPDLIGYHSTLEEVVDKLKISNVRELIVEVNKVNNKRRPVNIN